jgi:hypothetical protein
MAAVTRRQRELIVWLARGKEPAVFVLAPPFGIGALNRSNETHDAIRDDLLELVDDGLIRRSENRYEITTAGRIAVQRQPAQPDVSRQGRDH